tara:strand:- start:3528 stop:3863 length:336 start_codon:yes stop_codon:yes gene_type:complete
MKIKELNEKIRAYSEEGADRKKFKWKDIKDKHSDKTSLCCKAPIIILGESTNDDIGVCFKCKKFAIDKTKTKRLSQNRHQKFKRIADDSLYDFDSKKTNNYRTPKRTSGKK